MSDSGWIVGEYMSWINKAIFELEKLHNECNSSDKSRLLTKLTTLKIAKEHFDQLYREAGNTEI